MQAADETRYSTSAAPPRGRLSYWNDTVNSVFESLSIDSSEDSFAARLACRRIKDLDIAMVESSAATVRRLRHADAPDSSRTLMKIHLQDMGSSVNRQGGWNTTLADGEFTLCDGSRPYSIDFAGNNRMLVLRVPLDRLTGRLTDADRFTGRKLGRGARSAMFTSFLRNVWAAGEDPQDQMWGETISDVLVDLLVLALREPEAGEQPTLNPEWRRRLCAYVEEHLHEPDLRTSAIAATFGVTPRYIQMVFAGMETTVSAHILGRRLDHAAERLRQGLRDTPIADIAFDVGFQDLSHFSRSFRARFGVSAKQYRAGCRA